jgi:hypothetical protein
VLSGLIIGFYGQGGSFAGVFPEIGEYIMQELGKLILVDLDGIIARNIGDYILLISG